LFQIGAILVPNWCSIRDVNEQTHTACIVNCEPTAAAGLVQAGIGAVTVAAAMESAAEAAARAAVVVVATK